MIRKIMHRPQAVLGLAMMLLVFLVMLLAPVFAPNPGVKKRFHQDVIEELKE